jgi:hypothetical protein
MPTLNNVTNSPHAKSLGSVVRPLVLLNHSIRRLFDSMARYHAFVMGDVALYQSVLPKFAPKTEPAELGSSKIPDSIVTPPVSQIEWTPEEQVYINFIFMMNEGIHQHLIGGTDTTDEVCLYRAFRNVQAALQKFKLTYKCEPLPREFWILHIVAAALFLNGCWQVLRWFDVL